MKFSCLGMFGHSFILGVGPLPASFCSLTLPAREVEKNSKEVEVEMKTILHLVTHLPPHPLCHNDGKVFSLPLLPSKKITELQVRFEKRGGGDDLRNCAIRFCLLSRWAGVSESQAKIPRSYLRVDSMMLENIFQENHFRGSKLKTFRQSLEFRKVEKSDEECFTGEGRSRRFGGEGKRRQCSQESATQAPQRERWNYFRKFSLWKDQ